MEPNSQPTCPNCGSIDKVFLRYKCWFGNKHPWHSQSPVPDQFTVQEEAAIGELSRSLGISRIGVLRQGLRILQAVQAGVMELRDTVGKDKALPDHPAEAGCIVGEHGTTHIGKCSVCAPAPPEQVREECHEAFVKYMTTPEDLWNAGYAAGRESRK